MTGKVKDINWGHLGDWISDWICACFCSTTFLPFVSAALEVDDLMLDQNDDAVKTL